MNSRFKDHFTDIPDVAIFILTAMQKSIKLLYLFVITAVAYLFPTTINAQCFSDFQTSDLFCESDTIFFTFSGNGSQVNWIYGDSLSGTSNIDTARNGVHFFTSAGEYTVMCIASDSNCSDTSTQNITIVSPPTIDFSSSNSCLGLSTSFQSIIALDSADSLNTINWKLDTNNTASSMLTTYSFLTSGNKNISLSITTAKGCVDSFQRTIRIKDSATFFPDEDTLCQFDIMSFSLTTTESPSTWYWDFGDSSSSNISSPQHTYQLPGKRGISLELSYADGQTCFFAGDSVFIRPIPNPSFSIVSDTQQCFKDNEVCINLFPNKTAIQYRRIIWDDGGTTEPNTTDTLACYRYSDAFGGTYYITHELVDTFGCAAGYTTNKEVIVRKDVQATFDQSSSGGCFGATLSVQNTSNISPQAIHSFQWNFGNGMIDSTHWDSATQHYSSNGIFVTSLYVEDTFGCFDTFISPQKVENIQFIADARLDTTLNYCQNDNRFIFKQTSVPGASIFWEFGDGDSSFSFNNSHSYKTFGKYAPIATVNLKGCLAKIYLDTLTVYGPKARTSILNRFQCTIHDTVKFTNQSTVFENGPLQVYWEVNDPFASDCVIDTENGLNVGSNCNKSIDSLSFQHWFSPGTERCFRSKLVVIDTLVGCSDSIFSSLPLMPPSADTGLIISYNTLTPCPGPEDLKTVEIDLSNTEPGCSQERWYVMWDSACAAKSGNFDSNWIANDSRHNYPYNNISCNSSGEVSIGIIIQNGQDSVGVTCRDTSFYHFKLKLPVQNPTFNSSYDQDSTYCRNSSFNFFFTDTIQDTAQQVIWDFGDGTIDTTNNFNLVSHTYQSSGSHLTKVTLSHINGCIATYDMTINIGIRTQIDFPDDEVCLGDSIQISNISTYWNGNPFVQSNHSGMTYWDIGDSSSYQLGQQIHLNYSKIGDYPIKIFMEDSLGCKDTFQSPIKARVFSIFASWKGLPDTLVCPQAIQLFNTSTVYDSIFNFSHADDSLQETFWVFNQGTGSSSLQNPTKFFNTGLNVYSLKVKNTRGCLDSLIDSTYLILPQANYDIISDTQGCQPHQAVFKNTSTYANNYRWFLRDNANNVINSTDSQINFSYKDYGFFYPELIAEYSFRRNGLKYSCYDTFPSNNDTLSPKISVFERPKSKFSYLTNCNTHTTSFTNKTILHTDTFQSVLWLFGDGDSSTLFSPIHQYADTGTYIVTLKTTSGKGCENSISKEIIISPEPIADFDFSLVCFGNFTDLDDKTEAFNDRIYRWEWDFGDGSTSSIQNPKHKYNLDSSYNVSLRVKNRAGCSDTISQMVQVYNQPSAGFQTDSLCLYDTFNFSSNSFTRADSLFVHWTLGDGTESTDKNTQHRYDSAGEYPTKLVVTTNNGCQDSITRITKVYDLPKASFFINNDTQCLTGNQFEFTNNSTIAAGNITTHIWSTPDWGLDTAYNYSFSADTVKLYSVSLITISGFGCRDTFIQQPVSIESPDAQLWISSNDICSKDELVTLADITTSSFGNTIANREWTIDNTLTSTDSTFQHQFTVADTHSVQLILTFSNNCKDTTKTQIIARPKPQAVIYVNEIEKCLPWNEYTITDSSSIADNSSLTPFWDLGNNDSSLQISFNYTYSEADTFTISLVSQSTYGCKDTAYRNLVVFPHPDAQFSIDTTGLCLNDNEFNISNNSTIKSGWLNYQWDFDNADTSTLKNPTITYNTSGTKEIHLVAESDNGCKDSTYTTIEVYPHPIAVIGINDTAQCFNEQNVIFTDKSSITQGTLSSKWIWDDKSVDTVLIIEKTFDSASTYMHQLVSISEYSCTDTAYLQHHILPLPYLSYTLNDSAQCFDGNLFLFESLADTSVIAKYKWSFGDQSSDSSQYSAHPYTNPGVYDVELSLVTKRQCKDTINIPVEVYHKPTASFTVNDTDQCFNSHIFNFVGTSTIDQGFIENYYWTVGSNDTSKSIDTSIRFSDVGTYDVQYVVESENGCLDTSNQQITVHPNPVSAIFINDTIQCALDNLFSIESRSSIAYGLHNPSWYHDGSKISDSSTYQYSSSKSDTVLVILIDLSEKRCSDTASQLFYIVPNPTAAFVTNQSQQCLDSNQVIYTNTSYSRLGSLTYKWNFGDGVMDSTLNPDHRFINHGNFYTQLIAESSFGCKDTFQSQIFIYPMPTANFTLRDTSLCQLGNNFEVENNSTIDSTDLFFYWNWGDDETNQTKEPNHTYVSHGSYAIQLLVKSEHGCSDSIEHNVEVNPMPVANFDINDPDQCVNNQHFRFKNTSSIVYGDLTNVNWEIESNTYTNPDSINYFFVADGTYAVSLFITSDKNCKDTLDKQVFIYPKPKIEISVNDSVQCLRGNNVEYVAKSKDNLGLTTFHWIYQDTLVSTKTTYEYSYPTPGIKPISLIVTSVDNCADTSNTTIRIKPMPDPTFQELEEFYCIYDGPYNLIPVQTGGTFTGPNIKNQQYTPTILWQDSVTYTIDIEGCIDSSTQRTNVYPPPSVNFPPDTTVCKYESFELDATNFRSTYLWQDQSDKPTYMVVKPGKYFVQATNMCGIDSDTINVNYKSTNCRVYLPNAFTPNIDALNKYYKPIVFDVREIEYEIYNRWGEKLFVGNLNSLGWDGSYKGESCANGYYVVVVRAYFDTPAGPVGETMSEVLYLLR